MTPARLSLHQLLLPSKKFLLHEWTNVTNILDGLQKGFRVGFNPASVSLKSATQNMSSASLQPSVIDDYLRTELARGCVTGPFSSPFPHLHHL